MFIPSISIELEYVDGYTISIGEFTVDHDYKVSMGESLWLDFAVSIWEERESAVSVFEAYPIPYYTSFNAGSESFVFVIINYPQIGGYFPGEASLFLPLVAEVGGNRGKFDWASTPNHFYVTYNRFYVTSSLKWSRNRFQWWFSFYLRRYGRV